MSISRQAGNGKDFNRSTCVGRIVIVMDIHRISAATMTTRQMSQRVVKKRLNVAGKQELVSSQLTRDGSMTWNLMLANHKALTLRFHSPLPSHVTSEFLSDWLILCLRLILRVSSPHLSILSTQSDIWCLFSLSSSSCAAWLSFRSRFKLISKSFDSSRGMTLIGVWKRKQWSNERGTR